MSVELLPPTTSLHRSWLESLAEWDGALQHGASVYTADRLGLDLADLGGHIGYGIRPSARGRGLAARALRSTLPAAARLGLTEVLLTCDDDNPASYRTIETCGGVLRDVRPVDERGSAAGYHRPLRRYWVPTSGVRAG